MILDKETLMADDLAYNGTADVLDLESVGAGPGEPIMLFVAGSSDLAGATGVAVLDGATSSPSDDFTTHTCSLAGKTIQFEIPSDVNRYITVQLTGSPSAGSWNCGVVRGVQTAQ